jgi:hypothetical protein
LQKELEAFRPSEAEFRAVYVAKQSLAIRDPAGEPDEAFQTELRSAIGNERYVDYLRSTDPNYKLLTEIAERYELPEHTAADVLEIRSWAEQMKLNATSLSSEERPAALQFVQTVAQERVQTTLGGGRAFEHYRDNSPWLTQMSPPRSPP